MKVLLIGPYPEKDGVTVGGPERVIYTLSKAMGSVCKCKVYVISRSYTSKKVKVEKPHSNILLYRIPWDIFSIYTKRGLLTKIITQINPDVIHIHSPLDVYSVLKAKIFDIPLVLTLHGWIWDESKFYPGRMGRFRRTFYSKIAEQVIRDKRVNIVAINNFIKNKIEQKFPDKDIAAILENPIPYNFLDMQCRPEYPHKILFVGTISPLKNPLLLITAVNYLLKENKDIRCTLVGPLIDTRYQSKLLSFTKSNGLNSFVNIAGTKNTLELRKEYESAYALVLPSNSEVMPMCLIEAMAAGLPIIATNVGGVPEMIENGKNGFLVTPYDLEGLTECIKKLLENPKLAKEMSLYSKKIALNRWHPEVIAKQTVALYSKIIAEELP